MYGGCGMQPDELLPVDADVIFRDDFDESGLKDGWTFISSDASKRTLDERPGFVRIYPGTPAANVKDADPSFLVRELRGDFVLTVRMEFEPRVDLELAGLAVEGEDGRTVALGLISASNTRGTFRGLLMRADRGPNLDPGRAGAMFDSDNVYLRLQRIGDSYIGSYSEDGVTFTRVGALRNDLSNDVRGGIGTATSGLCTQHCGENVPADFDFFEVAAPSEDPGG